MTSLFELMQNNQNRKLANPIIVKAIKKLLLQSEILEKDIKEYLMQDKQFFEELFENYLDEFAVVLLSIFLKYNKGNDPILFEFYGGYQSQKCVAKLDFENTIVWLSDYLESEKSIIKFIEKFDIFAENIDVSIINKIYKFDCFIDKNNKKYLTTTFDF